MRGKGIGMELFDNIMEQTQEKAAAPGITLGLVKDNWDKDHPGMVKVELMLGEEEKSTTGWLPVMTPYGGSGYGLYALPEINSHVIVAFLQGDEEYPVVLGSLWNQNNKLPEKMAAEKNDRKCLLTKGGHEILFGEEDKKQFLHIRTPGKVRIELEDENKRVTMQDDSGDNRFVLDGKAGEITLEAKNKLSLVVNGKPMLLLDGKTEKMELKGNQIKAEAKQSMEWKGQKLAMGGASVEIKGDGTLKAESGGMLQIKGSLVKIN